MEQTDINGALFLVEAPLEDVINSFYHMVVASDGEPITRHVCPNLEMMLVFNFGIPVRISFHNNPLNTEIIRRTAAIGPLRQMLNYELLPGADALVVNFKFNGFQRLFGMPLTGLTGEEGTNAEILTDEGRFDRLWEELAALPTTEQRVSLLKQSAIGLLKENDQVLQTVIGNLAQFFNPRVDPVKAIAADTRLSERSIQLKFQKHTGYSVKELLRFLRFKEVIAYILTRSNQKIAIFDLIAEHDYHDQSHLIKDFQYFLGMAPQQFIKNLNNGSFCVVTDTYPAQP
ncbi:helix-turn-helix domain-containing protein [Dyadobacter fanqingshengii]|uniref:Helix-turn-helix domain-containing protein n=1 Tax=Dyadobacter fanqingshengii TaxID=2906443 RepID=A0A9X1T8D6_9BACT|nr:helix-turn-helix domain-containing protein [Dyadobacter fanqingshengii]MCF0040085.1 helix-turn-helix domain-containing protein [Dyadobacter fanqingshengii]USJ38163.1 helix-turn-helix domain-containing protein [Dyadobacter fanqingshengii]